MGKVQKYNEVTAATERILKANKRPCAHLHETKFYNLTEVYNF